MKYSDALKKLALLGPEMGKPVDGSARKFSLDLIRTLLDALGGPETRFASVLVAGTNGKGSSSATLAAIAAAAAGFYSVLATEGWIFAGDVLGNVWMLRCP